MDGTAIATKALLANNEVARYTLRFTHDVEPTAAQLASLAEGISTAIDSTLKPLFCSDITAFSVSAQTFMHAVGPGPALTPYWKPKSVEFSNVTPIGPGTHAGESLPPQNALVVTLRTALAGRSHLGRVYTFPPPESVVDASGQLVASHDVGNLVQLTIDSAVSQASGDGIALEACVFSAKLDSAEPIIATNVGTRIDTQRRRLQRTG